MSPTTSSTPSARRDFERRDRAAAETVAREASSAPGLRQIVYLGGLGDDSPDLSPHLRSRIETGRALASGSVPVTTLRAAMVVGAGSAAFETILALVDRLPAMICPRWVSTPTQPIALDDVVAYLAGVVRPRRAARRELRRRRPRGHDLPRDDRADRAAPRPAAADRRGSRPDARGSRRTGSASSRRSARRSRAR